MGAPYNKAGRDCKAQNTFPVQPCEAGGACAIAGRPREASWRSGYAEDCKSLHPGSIPGEASIARFRLGAGAEGDEAAELLLWPAARPNGQAVVACPGGGFNQVALEREGYPFARWFNERGVTYAVLCYRMPHGRAGLPAEDIRCALAFMRERAAEWGITRLGVMGASIGGHIAATAATLFEGEERPAFQILLYPVITMLDAWAHRPSRGRLMGENPSAELCERLSLELHVTPQTAPAFIVLAEDDAAVSPMHSLRYYEALSARGVPAQLHVYPRGGHSFAFDDAFPYKALWLAELERFLGEV